MGVRAVWPNRFRMATLVAVRSERSVWHNGPRVFTAVRIERAGWQTRARALEVAGLCAGAPIGWVLPE